MPHSLHMVRWFSLMDATTYESLLGWAISLSILPIIALFVIAKIWGNK
jgi:hypothetical protein